MTLIYQLDLTIVGMYMRTKNELSRLKLFKVGTVQTDRHTNRHTDVTKYITSPLCWWQ